jgi:hypothetical protein
LAPKIDSGSVKIDSVKVAVSKVAVADGSIKQVKKRKSGSGCVAVKTLNL